MHSPVENTRRLSRNALHSRSVARRVVSHILVSAAVGMKTSWDLANLDTGFLCTHVRANR